MGTTVDSIGPLKFNSQEEQDSYQTKLLNQIIEVNSLYQRNNIYVGLASIIGLSANLGLVILYLQKTFFADTMDGLVATLLAIQFVCAAVAQWLFSYPVGKKNAIQMNLGYVATAIASTLAYSATQLGLLQTPFLLVIPVGMYVTFKVNNRLENEMTDYHNSKVPPDFR